MLALRTPSRDRAARSSGLPAAVNTLLASAAAGPGADAEARSIHLVTRSPQSPVAQHLWSRLPELASAGVTVTACFSRLPRRRAALGALAQYAACYGDDAASRNIRVAAFARAGNIFEQAVIGRLAIWTGQRLRRRAGAQLEAGQLTAINVETESRGTVSLARLMFTGVWEASRPLTRGSWLRALASFVPARSAGAH